MAVKLRKRDKETLDKLVDVVGKLRGDTSKSEVVGLSLKFARSNQDGFLKSILEGVGEDSLLGIVKNSFRGTKTDARKIEEYLYGRSRKR